jgi:hypothetical protein
VKNGRLALVGVFAALALGLAWVLFVGLPRWYGPAPANVSAPVPSAAGTDTPARRIHAQLFYVAAGGRALTSSEAEVGFAEDPIAQAREILRVQLMPPEPPLVSAIPPGTELRAVFITPRGEAYVDLSQDVVTAHTGGSVGELLTIYTIVHALTANLRAVTSVQILVEGREVETLAGHVNLQRPLSQRPDWVR